MASTKSTLSSSNTYFLTYSSKTSNTAFAWREISRKSEALSFENTLNLESKNKFLSFTSRLSNAG